MSVSPPDARSRHTGIAYRRARPPDPPHHTRSDTTDRRNAALHLDARSGQSYTATPVPSCWSRRQTRLPHYSGSAPSHPTGQWRSSGYRTPHNGTDSAGPARQLPSSDYLPRRNQNGFRYRLSTPLSSGTGDTPPALFSFASLRIAFPASCVSVERPCFLPCIVTN